MHPNVKAKKERAKRRRQQAERVMEIIARAGAVYEPSYQNEAVYRNGDKEEAFDHSVIALLQHERRAIRKRNGDDGFKWVPFPDPIEVGPFKITRKFPKQGLTQEGWVALGYETNVYGSLFPRYNYSSKKDILREAERYVHLSETKNPSYVADRDVDYLKFAHSMHRCFGNENTARHVGVLEQAKLERDSAEEKKAQEARDADAKRKKAEEMHAALKVVSLDPKIRAFLKENDPQALKQIVEALEGTPEHGNEAEAELAEWYEKVK